jgi:3-isopropylmalate dehydrogenase
MLLRHSFGRKDDAARIERAVRSVLAAGYRTADIMQPGMRKAGTVEMGDAVVAALGRATG